MEFVTPWLAALRECTELARKPSEDKIRDARSSGTLWVSWRPQRNGRGRYDYDPFPSEAFEILALFSVVDYDTWLQTIRDLWPQTADVWLRVFRGQRFQLGVELSRPSLPDLSEWCGQFLLGDAGLVATVEYQRARVQLQTLAADTVCVPVRVLLDAPSSHYMGNPDIQFGKTWFEVLQVALLQATIQSRSIDAICDGNGCSPLLKLSEVKVDMPGNDRAWVNKALLCASQVVGLGIKVHPVDLRGIEMTGEMASHWIPSLQRLVGAGSHVHGADAVLIDSSTIQSIDACFSALLVTKSVRDLRVTKNASKIDRQHFWRWISLVFFSNHGTTSVEKLTVDVSKLKKGDVDTVKQVLQATDPISLIYKTDGANRVVSASKFYLSDPEIQAAGAGNGSCNKIEFTTPLTSLRVLHHASDSKWISVLLPGWGQAWVAASDGLITEVHTGETPTTRQTYQLVLTNARKSQGAEVIALLSLVAPQVRTLCLHNCEFSGADMRRILSTSPLVEEIKLSGTTPVNLQAIASAYEDGGCRAERLYLKVARLLVEEEAYQFFNLLQNADHPMAKCVRDLHFTYESTRVFPQVRPSVLGVLQQNRWLRELYVKIESHEEGRADERDEQRQLQAECNQFDGTTAVAPLDIAKKLAFLSVVHAVNADVSTPQVSSAIRSFDSNILTGVFQFAAETPCRFVHVRFGLFRYAED